MELLLVICGVVALYWLIGFAFRTTQMKPKESMDGFDTIDEM